MIQLMQADVSWFQEKNHEIFMKSFFKVMNFFPHNLESGSRDILEKVLDLKAVNIPIHPAVSSKNNSANDL